MKNLLTIILPVHNEEENLEQLVSKIDQTFNLASEDFHSPFLIFVDDGSSDNSLEVIQKLIASRGNIGCISFSRNFGHQVAILAGMNYASPNSIVLVMDSDGQDPPYVGIDLAYQIVQGNDIAYGIRKQREGKNLIKKLLYWLFYRLFSWLSMIEIPLDAGDFCAYSPKAIQLLCSLKEKHPYVRGLRAWIGLKQIGIPYKRPERNAGKASYTFKDLFNLATDGIISFSVKPLRLSVMIGLLTFFICFLLIVTYTVAYIFDLKFGYLSMRNVPGFTTLILLTLMFNGLQMIMIGLIGEYLSRVFEESKGRPLYIVSQVLGNIQSQIKYE
ncbi:MAG: glycosyltransferase family 2 protein [Pseudanabaena sp. M135S2SP2A07QC]|jgi:glycosyltransferase involved in cell wall biosynthesis|uniref:glycosyltransferase family 2 protein n=2 Tax=unclassified Microcystis TaxID=2643300 RepID=UPI00258ADDA0|nr:glycosyltransferase family 2 protein [Microcystis sp. M158S2]MCA6534559.1 glycosyltransferase family 2 protein [Pseudanabaena sp. M176S2SP2A07QC]MCA6537268.1 glycosyltransferase family 2 protein [Pseudanabaena sp. M037S2SP2A07QC]MCA6548962.1 glycosyltransferase family 2 protein [Pseudanabaena sp. M152S2SP2A07QC]MCA6553365.1 glycosyltransferase family 2 protein [Pseudanabaena sp. M135S2SP2A07QC]MCA6564873.1 glycosyltransferase family 2 protein [Pseudanabaena sp. M151S2SP2A07QC]MCA6571634.1 